MSAREEGIRAAARWVRGSRVEYAVLLDANGMELWRGKGMRRSVAVPVDEAPAGSIVVHSHPGPSDWDMPLSYQDVALLAEYGMSEIVAVHVTWTHRMRLPVPRRKLSLAAEMGLAAFRSAEENLRPTRPERLAGVASLLGGRYSRVPTCAWLQGAGWVAPARGPAEPIEALTL